MKINVKNRLALICVGLRCFSLVLVLMTLSLPVPADEARPTPEAPMTSQPNTPSPTNWLKREIRLFRTYPHLDKAYRLMEDNRLQEAKEELEKYIHISPRDQAVRATYVVLLYQLKEYVRVIQEAEDILKIQPESSTAFLYKGLAHQNLDQSMEAIKSFRGAAGLKDISRDDRVFALNMVADLAIKEQSYQEALNALQEIKTIQEGFNLYYRLGMVEEKLGHHDETEHNYHKALELTQDPGEQRNVFLGLGEFYKKEAQWEKAQAMFESALNQDPDNPEILDNLTQLAYQQEKYGQSLQWMQHLFSINKTVDNQKRLANILYSSGRLTEAVTEYTHILASLIEKEDVALILMTRGYIYQQLKEYKLSAEDFKAAATMTGDIKALLAYSQILEDMGNLPEAIKVTEEGLEKGPSYDLHLRLGLLYSRIQNNEKALKHLTAARNIFEQNQSDKPLNPEIYAQLGDVFLRSKSYSEAIKHFEKSVSIEETPEVLQQLAFTRIKQGDLKGAVKTNEQLLKKTGLISSKRKEVLKVQANLYSQLGDDARAVQSFQNVLKEREDDWEARRGLGMSLYKLGRWQEAAEEFRLANDLHPDPAFLLYLSRCYTKLNKPDVATYYLKAAHGKSYMLDESEQLNIDFELGNIDSQRNNYILAEKTWTNYLNKEYDARVALSLGKVQRYLGNIAQARRTFENILSRAPEEVEAYQELAYVHAQEGNYKLAAQVLQQCLDLKRDPHVALSLGKMYQLAGDADHAQRILENITEEELPVDLEVRWLNTLAEIYEGQHKFKDAEILKTKANSLRTLPEHHFESGLFYQKLGLWNDAIISFETALSEDPQNVSYAKHLGYVYVNIRKYDEAISVFEKIVAQDPRAHDLYKELGYLNMKIAANDKAISWFNRAINHRLEGHNDADPKNPESDEEVEHLRKEIHKLENRFNFTLYQMYRPNTHNKTNAPSGVGTGGSILSQGGIDMTYQPPVIGFRDERIFQITSRILWSTPPNSLAIEEDSYQGGVGVRYKPFRLYNFFMGAERLIKIGDQAQDNWLFRQAYSWDNGMELKRGKKCWNYSSFYMDAGYFLENPSWAYSAEVRQGVSVNYKNFLVITPQLIVNGRWENPDPSSVSYSEGGPGILFTHTFNADKEEGKQTNLELLLQYKIPFDGSSSGFVLSMTFRY